MEDIPRLVNSMQHGQAGSADAPPKFCSASLRKTSAVPGNVVRNKPVHAKTGNRREKTKKEDEEK